ncbi:MAG: hypothetical protein AAFR52_11500 [Pseudomonadota bacterium]
MSEETRKARVRLTADFVSRLGVNAIAVGVFAPPVSIVLGGATADPWPLVVLAASFLVLGGFLHHIARRILRRIDRWD